MRRILYIPAGTGLCGALLMLAAAPGEVRAGVEEKRNPLPPVAPGQGEEWLGEGGDLQLEMAHVTAAGRKGELSKARRELERIMVEAEGRGLRRLRLQAQQWWVRFTALEQPDADVTPAIGELFAQARKLGASGGGPEEEAEIFALWGDVLKGQGQWLMAVKAQDRVTQLSLENDRVARAVEAFLVMARLCREAGHGWRLAQVWVRLDQVLRERPGRLGADLLSRVENERQEGQALLRTVPEAAGGEDGTAAGVDLQPRDNRVMVSLPDRELARSRFLLTNASPFPAEGVLMVQGAKAPVTSWQSGEGGFYITMGEAAAKNGGDAPAGASRAVRLRPGQQLEVYVEQEPQADGETVRISWQGTGAAGQESGAVTASGTFYFVNGLPAVSVVNAGEFRLRPGWCLPLYHEIYQRGRRVRIENLAVQASAPCRLEIYDHDTGRLLAVDAEGDGTYSSPGDQVLEDADRDGGPDLIVGDRARAVEIAAWPLDDGLQTAGREGLTVKVGLKPADGGGAGNLNGVENVVRK